MELMPPFKMHDRALSKFDLLNNKSSWVITKVEYELEIL